MKPDEFFFKMYYDMFFNSYQQYLMVSMLFGSIPILIKRRKLKSPAVHIVKTT